MKIRKKLIEVALPLEAINKASAREKSIRHGHPSTLHLWWARRPLAAARAVIFAQMVDDPSEYIDTLLSDPANKRSAKRELAKRHEVWLIRNANYQEALRVGETTVTHPGDEPNLEDCLADLERERLFKIIEDFVLWENTSNEEILERASAEIWQSWRRACADNADHPRARELFDRNKLPAFHDPFAGGGALPLEAQRLGLESLATDINPVAVLINKAMIEIPPKFAGRAPINPKSRDERERGGRWNGGGAQGLAEDVRYYGQWMHDEAEKRIGHLYPKVEITAEIAADRPDLMPLRGQKLTVIAWLWARTVMSPDPAFANAAVPLVANFMLSTKSANKVYVDPVVKGGEYHFVVRMGQPAAAASEGTKLGRGNFTCVLSKAPISSAYIKAEARAGRLGTRLMAVVAESDIGRVYLSPTDEMERVARQATPDWRPDTEFFEEALGFRVGNYGMKKWSDLYTDRQLVALTTFCDLVREARELVNQHAQQAGLIHDDLRLRDGGGGAEAYADAIALYLGLTSSKAARFTTTLSTWRPDETKLSRAFTRNDIAMTWDFAETNPFSGTGGDFGGLAFGTASVLEHMPTGRQGSALAADAQAVGRGVSRVISTDPPYYDNIGYADLSDYFYVWLRRSLKPYFPDLFATLSVPKDAELVATPARHGGKREAEIFFLNGMTEAMRRLVDEAYPGFPVTIYYAFKQAESDSSGGVSSTGWETFLDAVIRAGFAINGTWPVRTEGKTRMRGMSSNALASSIVLVCRARADVSHTVTRREFLSALKAELPPSLIQLQRSNIAPVDLAQAAIGPGMAIYTRYGKVLEAEGKTLTVRDALTLINQTLDEVLTQQEGDFDSDSRWALAWFEQYGFAEGDYGQAETLSKAKNTSVSGLVEAGILASKAGKVRLLRPTELPTDWDPISDARLTVWETVHHLIRLLEALGENSAAALVVKLGSKAEVARELAYRLYTVCERKKRAVEALSYNGLVQSWPEIMRLGQQAANDARPAQAQLL